MLQELSVRNNVAIVNTTSYKPQITVYENIQKSLMECRTPFFWAFRLIFVWSFYLVLDIDQ